MIDRRIAALGLALLTAACTGRASMRLPDSEQQLREAAAAMERDDFAGATESLVVVASDCTEARQAHRALLLLAAASLDTGNPQGSPTAATSLSERYLLLADPSPEEWLLARTLYRIATHLETLAPRQEGSDGDAAPTPPSVDGCGSEAPSDDALLTLALGSAAAPWLLDLEGDRSALRRRAEQLQAELDRIKAVLTTSPESPEPPR